MRKYISILALSLFLGFLVFNISSNRPSAIPPLEAAPNPCLIFPSPPSCHPPSVTTSPASSITATGATLNGEITALNGAGIGSVGERGFQYGLTEDYGSTVNQLDPDSLFDVGAFSININSLSCNTTYHYIAYATNNRGAGYGNDATLTTNSCVHYSSGRTSSSTSSPSSVSSTTLTSPVAPFVATPPYNPPVSPCQSGDKFSTATGLQCTSFIVPPTSPTTPAVTFVRIIGTLVYGSAGDEVRTLQAGLNDAGFNSGPVDGIFGPITKGAVIRFQLAHGLVGDGIFGPLTRAALDSR